MYGHEELPPMENQTGNSMEAGFGGFASYIAIQWAEAVIFYQGSGICMRSPPCNNTPPTTT